MKKTRTKKLLVKKAESGLGLFSNSNFQKGDFIIEYTGKLLSAKEADQKGGRYLFEINSRWTIDGTERKNVSRYINHSCRPNAEPYMEGRRIMIYAKKKINLGEEITYHYGKEYFNEFIKPIGCRCPYCQKKK